MSATNLYQMYDTQAQTVVGPILSVRKEGAATRAFCDTLGNPQTDPGRYPADYQLQLLGTQDEDTGLITPELEPKVIYTGLQWLAARKLALATEEAKKEATA